MSDSWWFYSAIGWHHSGPRPQVASCQWATVSRSFSQLSVEWWSSGGEWGKSWIQPSPLVPASAPGWGSAGKLGGVVPGNSLGAVSCRAPEPSLGTPTGLIPGLEVTMNPLPHLHLCDLMATAVHIGCSLGPAPAIGVAWGARGPVGLWVPGSLCNESWAGSGDLALRESLTDLPLSQDRDLRGQKLCRFLSE